MLILFDNGTPAPFRDVLHGHIVVEAIERGWDRLTNGELIAASEAEGFELLLTTDKNIRYQQNLKGRKIAFVVIGNQQWPTLRRYVERVVAAVNAATPVRRSKTCSTCELPGIPTSFCCPGFGSSVTICPLMMRPMSCLPKNSALA
jgi:hypothetical protein